MTRRQLLLLTLLATSVIPSAARADWQPVNPKAGCLGLSFTDSGKGYMIRSSSLGSLTLHTWLGTAWDAGTSISSAELLLFQGKELRFVDDQTGFLAGVSEKIFRTEDGGKTWTGVKITFSPAALSASVVDLDFGSKTHGVAVGTKNITAPFLATTTDGGKTWNEVTSPGSAIKVAMAGAGVIVAGGTLAGAKPVIWTSTDGGKTWAERAIAGKLMQDITFITDKIGFVMVQGLGAATTNEALLVTTDGAKTWAAPSSAYLPLQSQITAWVDAQNGFIGGRSADNKTLAIARTTDGGKTWTLETMPPDAEFQLPSTEIRCMAYPGPAAFAGTSNGSVRNLVNTTAGGKAAPRYGAAPATDGGVLADAGTKSDGGSKSDGGAKGDAKAPGGDGKTTQPDGGARIDAAAPSGGDGGGCSFAAGLPAPYLGLVLLLGVLALIARRRR